MEREEARRVETSQSQTEEVMAKKDQELRVMKLKWTQRVEERLAHLNHNTGIRKDK